MKTPRNLDHQIPNISPRSAAKAAETIPAIPETEIVTFPALVSYKLNINKFKMIKIFWFYYELSNTSNAKFELTQSIVILSSVVSQNCVVSAQDLVVVTSFV